LREDGGDVVLGKRLKPFIANHYKKLFTSCAGQRTDEVLQAVPSKVSPTMNETLLRSFTGEEVEEALNGIGDLKAPGDQDQMVFPLSSTNISGGSWEIKLKRKY